MSRHRSSSSTMGPSTDRDVVMGPPTSTTQPKPKDGQEISEKYRKLKRRFFELEEKHKETSSELQRSGERNLKMREERNILLDRIIELESENQPLKSSSPNTSPPPLQPSSSAFPRTLLNARTRTSLAANIRNTHTEDRVDDDLDPIQPSRPSEPDTHNHNDDDSRERCDDDDDSRDPRNGNRRRMSNSSHQGNLPVHPPHNASGSMSSSEHTLMTTPSPPGTDSHTPQHTQAPTPLKSQDQNNSSSSRHSHSPKRASAPGRPPCSRSGADVEMNEDHHDNSLQLNSPGSGSSNRTQDADPDCEGQTSPHQDEAHKNHLPGTLNSTASSRSPRRSSRVAAASRVDREPEPTRRIRGLLKRRLSSSPTVTAARKTGNENIALATAVAAAQAEATVEMSAQPGPSLPHDSPTSLVIAGQPHLPTPPSSKSSASLPADDRDTEMEDVAEQQAFKQPILTSTFSAESSSEPSAIQAQSTTEGSRQPSAAPSTPIIDPNIDPALGTTGSGTPMEVNDSAKEATPMENIVKVAAAAIAAQNAAKASKNSPHQSISSSSSSTTQVQSTAPAAPGSPSVSVSPTSYNPYMITTQMVAGKPTINTLGVATSPSMVPLSMNPYAMYYSPVNTPLTPGTPTYPYPYANPYYYLTGPMPGPSSAYPTSPNFVPPSAQRPPSEVQRQTKPKRLKAHTVTSKSFSIPMVPRDKRGKPMLPLNVGIMTVINLGDVCMREHFHTERYIFPVGYEVSRRYLSTIDPNIEVVYHCTILDGGDGPKFQIVPSDVPDRPVIAGTATGAWSSIVKQANAIRNRQHSNSVSGPDFFGLGQNTIKHLIQELPNADRLRDYVWQTFIEGGPLGGRHAAVIPALPEEYDASMPIGAYYPTDRDRRRQSIVDTPEASTPKGLSHYPQHIIAQAEAQRAQQQALHKAQQMGAQPLQPGESSGTIHSKDTTGSLPLSNRLPEPARSSDGPSASPSDQALQSGVGSSATSDGPAVPATFASIMNAYPTAGASNSQVPDQQKV